MSHGSRIHPTALISPEAQLAEDVVVGAYSIIEGPVKLGPGCVIRPHVHLIGPLNMGQGNQCYTGSVIGEGPQHLKYNNEPTRVDIGDHNIFREHVTVHRATAHSWATKIGSHNFFMAGSHVAHDAVIGNRCILANGALVAGHCVIEDNVFLSGNSAVHQFIRVGRLAMLSGCSISSRDMPPFCIEQGINCIVAVNVVGMRRAGMSNEQIDAVRRAYSIIFQEGHLLSQGLEQAEKELGQVDAVAELVKFIRQSTRGIATTREHRREVGILAA
jgi:UDP-N-acetylglucosamine acyltransferase